MVPTDEKILNDIIYAINVTYQSIAPDVMADIDFFEEDIEWAEIVCDGNKVESFGELEDESLEAWKAMTWEEKQTFANNLRLW